MTQRPDNSSTNSSTSTNDTGNGLGNANGIDTDSLKKEIKQELLKREIMMGLDNSDEIDLFELGKVMLRRWRIVFVMPIIVGLLAVVFSLMMPNYYKSEACIFVHSKGGGAMSSLLSSLPLGGLGGLGGSGGSAEYLMAYLKSRTSSDQIITRFGIATSPLVLGDDPLPVDLKYDDLVKAVGNMVTVSKDKDGLITVAVETKSATFSAEVAETYLAFLENFSKGPAKEKRVFVQVQLDKVKTELETAEITFKTFQDKNKLFAIDEQAKGLIEKSVKLEASKFESQISLKMQESLLKSSGNVPELVKLEAQKVSEEARQAGLEKAISEVNLRLDAVPQLTLEFTHLMRNLKVKEKVFEMLTEQLELAKISEAEEGSNFEVIDHARPAERKSKPKRSLIVILSGLTAGMLGVFLAFFLEFLEKRRKDDQAKSRSAPAAPTAAARGSA